MGFLAWRHTSLFKYVQPATREWLIEIYYASWCSNADERVRDLLDWLVGYETKHGLTPCVKWAWVIASSGLDAKRHADAMGRILARNADNDRDCNHPDRGIH